MKKLFFIVFGLIAIYNCNGQRYQVWVNTLEKKQYSPARNLGSFDDSVLSVYSNPTFFTLTKNYNYNWDEIEELKIRNKSLNQLTSLLGIGVGLLSFNLYVNSLDDRGNPFGPIFLAPVFIGGGALTGYLVTSKKIIIPLDGKNSLEKSQALKNKIHKKL